jgi:Putative transmembrane protein (PGPGW)
MAVVRKVWVTALGWVIALVGVAALVLPGPGLLLLLLGLAILSQEYEWAERRIEPLKEKAFQAAAAGVQTWPRISLSLMSVAVVTAIGVIFWLDPKIPTFWIIGPELPFGGWTTGVSIISSALIALTLIGYSMRRFRGGESTNSSAEDAEEDRLAT